MNTAITSGQIAGHQYVYQVGDPTSTRVLLLLHGVGGDEFDLLPLGRHLDPTAHLLSPRGPIFDEGANRFFHRLSDGSFDAHEVTERVRQLADFITDAKVTHDLGNCEIIAIGFSNGANMAASLLLLEPTTLDGAVLLRVKLPLVPTKNPNLRGHRVLALSGEYDPIMPRDSAVAVTRLLHESGADIRHDWLPAGHQLTQEDIDRTAQWLKSGT